MIRICFSISFFYKWYEKGTFQREDPPIINVGDNIQVPQVVDLASEPMENGDSSLSQKKVEGDECSDLSKLAEAIFTGKAKEHHEVELYQASENSESEDQDSLTDSEDNTHMLTLMQHDADLKFIMENEAIPDLPKNKSNSRYVLDNTANAEAYKQQSDKMEYFDLTGIFQCWPKKL